MWQCLKRYPGGLDAHHVGSSATRTLALIYTNALTPKTLMWIRPKSALREKKYTANGNLRCSGTILYRILLLIAHKCIKEGNQL